jgi:uncharacterized coiled-coil DUF342 family protein
MSPDHKDLIERMSEASINCGTHPQNYLGGMLREGSDAIAALVAERDECNEQRSETIAMCEQLRAERDAAVSDAERYRWLRNARSPFCVSRYDKRPNEHYYGIDLDDAIDAARKNAG